MRPFVVPSPQDYDASRTDLKWSLHSLKTFLCSMHGQPAANQTFGRIQHIIIQSLVRVDHKLQNKTNKI